MRILGVDYGQKRIGLAISDETETLASGLEYLRGGELGQVAVQVARFADDHQAGRIVVGVPLSMSGQPSQQTERTIVFINALQTATALPVARWDERLTSVQAERVLIEGGVRRRQRREKIDQLAAQLMLQSYLDAQANE